MSHAPKDTHRRSRKARSVLIGACAGTACFALVLGIRYSMIPRMNYYAAAANADAAGSDPVTPPPTLDKAAYDAKMIAIANENPAGATSTASSTPPLWPVRAVYPNAGAILPFERIVAYYGNFYSTGMGVLGEYPAPEMLDKLKAAAAEWQAADPSTPVVPAIEYIDVTAQGTPGANGTYSLRMPDDQIDHALDLAKQVNGIVILDLQVGLSTLPVELPLIEKYLAMPQVHLAIDPEFSMKDGAKPGTEIGTFDASDINYAANYLAMIVRDNNLPPKILIVHRFTQEMVTHYKEIKPLPEVEIVMDMDGWGSPSKKIGTYNAFIASEPVQFTGFKLFYVNDLRPPSTRMLTPAEILKLTPQPVYIQYQ
jgi:hypothetical protein